ncbi:hypothetical protein CO655_24995 [Rhizobium sp. M1]|nr:hypothetical protein CO655_24995 [Rhizobium sp. M1]
MIWMRTAKSTGQQCKNIDLAQTHRVGKIIAFKHSWICGFRSAFSIIVSSVHNDAYFASIA